MGGVLIAAGALIATFGIFYIALVIVRRRASLRLVGAELEEDRATDKHGLGSMVLKQLNEVSKLIREAKDGLQTLGDLSSGWKKGSRWKGGELSEEEWKEKKIEIYVDVDMALQKAQIELEFLMTMVAEEL